MEKKLYYCHEWANSRTIAKLSEFPLGRPLLAWFVHQIDHDFRGLGKRTTNA